MATEIRRIREATESQLRKTDGIIASNQAIADAISEVTNALEADFTLLGSGLQELCCITDNRFQEAVDRLELQGKVLSAIKEILERPLDTQAKELRKRAEMAYLNNWFAEAESDLLAAAERNYQDFIVHQLLGNIYYHHKGNHQKALEHYQKAAKYATPVSRRHAAKALVSVAMVYHRLGRLGDAYKATNAAIQVSPGDPHVLYQHARYAAKAGYAFTGVLKECIDKDPKYLITADRDDMYSGVRDRIGRLAADLRDERKSVVDNIIRELGQVKEEAEAMGICQFESLENGLGEVGELYARNSYLDFVEAERKARETYEKSLSEWVRVKSDNLAELRKREIGVSDRMVKLGFVAAIVAAYLSMSIAFIVSGIMGESTGIWGILMLICAPIVLPLAGIGGLLFDGNPVSLIVLGIPVVPFFVVSVLIKNRLLNALKREIERENDAIQRLVGHMAPHR